MTIPIGLTIEKIGNPSREVRQPVAPSVFPVNDEWISRIKKPTDKNTMKRLTERQQMVLYPVQQTRHVKKLRDHDMIECSATCNFHQQYATQQSPLH